MIKRLRIKFICINMTIVTVMLLVIFGTVFYFTGENLERQSIRAMEAAGQLHLPPLPPGEKRDKFFLPGFVVEVDGSGEITVRSEGFFDLSDETMVHTLLQLVEESGGRTDILPEYRLRYLVMPAPAEKRIVFADMTSELETMQNLLKNCVVIGVLSMAAFLGISIFLANWAVRPVEKAWEQQRQFVADASHELKTPLTVIITNAELLQNADYGREESCRFSQNILVMSHQMRSLVESLLKLARVDNGTAKMDFQKLDFSTLTEECLLRFEPVYYEKGRILDWQMEEKLFVHGSADFLCQVVDILLDNGCKYAQPGSTVTVKLWGKGNQCLLSVASVGAPIEKEDLKNIFKRFYRVDKVRSRDGSFGLGLSIAESIIQEHGGKIWAESDAGVNTFFVQLNLMRG